MADTTTESVEETQAPATGSPREEQPDGFDNETAVEGQSESSNDSEPTDGEETPEPQEDGDKPSESDEDMSEQEIRDWVEKKGYDLDNPIQLAKGVRELEKKMHQQGVEVGELRKQMSEQVQESAPQNQEQSKTDYETEVTRMRVNNFFSENPDARTYESKMVEIVKEKPHLGQDLETLYTVAKARSNDAEKEKARKDGKKSALQQVEKKQRRAAPKTSARQQEKTPEEDPFLKGFDSE